MKRRSKYNKSRRRFFNGRGFSHKRITYIPEEATVTYRSKDGKQEKVFDALEWIAAMCSHVPNKGNPAGRDYYGYYSNVSRGKRKKSDQDDPLQRRPDITLAKEKLQWAPGVEIEQGLMKTVEYFRGVLAK